MAGIIPVFNALMTVCFVTLVSLAIIAAGCGGGKGEESEGLGKIYGRVAQGVVPAAAPATGTAQTGFTEDLKVRAYELDGAGDTLKPLKGVKPAAVDGRGNFELEKVPTDVPNVIIRLEKGEGMSPIMSAVVPAVKSDPEGTGGVFISAETDLETEIFREIVRTGFSQPADTEPPHVDAVFIVTAIGLDGFATGATSTQALAADLAGAVKDALKVYSKAVLGAEKPPSHSTLKTIRSETRQSLTDLHFAVEGVRMNGSEISPPNLFAIHKEMESARRSAIKGIALGVKSVPEETVLARAEALRDGRFADCLRSVPGAKDCPAFKSPPETLRGIADAAERSLSARAGVHSAWQRWNRLTGTTAPGETGGDEDQSAPLTAFRRLVNVPEAAVQLFDYSLRRNWDELAGLETKPGTETSPLHRFYLASRNMRNYLVSDYVAEDRAFILETERGLINLGKNLKSALSDEAVGPEGVEKAWDEFQNGVERLFTPLRTLVSSRVPNMPETDRKKLYWAVREMFLLSALPDVPVEYLAGADTDGDGFPDGMEEDLESDPMKSGSTPPPPLSATSRAFLPPPPVDADGDGISDYAETAAGADPANRDSVPTLLDLLWCAAPVPTQCPKPEDGIDSDADGRIDEEVLDGLDNDGDLRIDEDPGRRQVAAPPKEKETPPGEAQPPAVPDTGAQAEPMTETVAGTATGTATASPTVEISVPSQPATVTFTAPPPEGGK
ncbi:MAG: hypothetical protein AB1742_03500 [bacterium]